MSLIVIVKYTEINTEIESASSNIGRINYIGYLGLLKIEALNLHWNQYASPVQPKKTLKEHRCLDSIMCGGGQKFGLFYCLRPVI